ncbi:MAG: OsmC family protein [Planctomycetota bacterium]
MSRLQVNGIDVKSLMKVVENTNDDETDPTAEFGVRTTWRGQTSAESVTTHLRVGAERIPRHFRVHTDVPVPLCGNDSCATPQELLLSALNACLTVGYAAGAALRGIEIEELEIETVGELDLRGYFDMDESVDPGFQKLDCRVKLRADTSTQRIRNLHAAVLRTSPNLFNLTRAVRIRPELG